MSLFIGNSKPMLNIAQPKLKETVNKMQTRYWCKVSEEETLVKKKEKTKANLPEMEMKINAKSDVQGFTSQEETINDIENKTEVIEKEYPAMIDQSISQNTSTLRETTQASAQDIEFDWYREISKLDPLLIKAIKENTSLDENQIRSELLSLFKNSINHEEVIEKIMNGNNDANLVEIMVKALIPRADPEVIREMLENIEEQRKAKQINRDQTATQMKNNTLDIENSPESAGTLPISEENRLKILRLVTRLSRYPNVLPKPYCEAVVNGEKVTFQIETKRGGQIRVKEGKRYRIIEISDITDINVL
jgi:hypothetical protein